MSSGDKKKSLTGWLILLMVMLTVGSWRGAGNGITDVRRSYEPYFLQYPTLPRAVLAYQVILLASFCTALFTAWVLYQRVPGTLVVIKRAFVTTMVLRMTAGWFFELIAGLPDELLEPLRSEMISTLGFATYGIAW